MKNKNIDNENFDLSLYDYNLPSDRIALEPAKPRDFSKLMVYNTQKDEIIFDIFYNLQKYLDENYFLVFNQTKVLPARVNLFKKTGGKIKILLLLNEKINEIKKNKIKEIRGIVNKEIRLNEKLYFYPQDENNYLIPIKQEKNIFTFKVVTEDFLILLKKMGEVPLPPYLKRTHLNQDELRRKYQSIFAKKIGSIAAPTASFHFTRRVLKRLKSKKINFCFITLHVGLATFTPLNDEFLRKKKLPLEYWEIDLKNYKKIKKLKKENKKLVAVGTTTTRMLESLVRKKIKANKKIILGETDLFIMPPFKFKIVDALITNFHLPRSSLMMLVEAFLQFKKSPKHLKELYQIAIDNDFRFYSFGDAMLII